MRRTHRHLPHYPKTLEAMMTSLLNGKPRRCSKESLIINRDDFWATTSNKQLNFLQHIFTILKQHGRADRKSEGRAMKEEGEFNNPIPLFFGRRSQGILSRLDRTLRSVNRGSVRTFDSAARGRDRPPPDQ
jgi:hypothetical protein